MFEIKNLKFKGKRKKFIVLLEELCFLIIVDFVARQNKGSFFYSLPFSLLCGLVSGLPFADLARSQRPFSPVTGGGGGLMLPLKGLKLLASAMHLVDQF